MDDKTEEPVETTDSWEWPKIIKHVFLPKPKGSPKAGKKEIGARAGIGTVCALIAFSSFFSEGLPTCKSNDATDLAEEIISGMSIMETVEAKFITIKDISEQGFNEKTEVRSCEGTLVTTVGETDLQYSIYWENEEKVMFYVRVRII